MLEWIKEHEHDTDIVRFFLMVGWLFLDSYYSLRGPVEEHGK